MLDKFMYLLEDSQVFLFFIGMHTLLWCTMKFSAIDHPPVKVAWAILSQAVQIAVFRGISEPAGDDNFPDHGYWWYFINALTRLIIQLGVWAGPEEGAFPAKAALLEIGAHGWQSIVVNTFQTVHLRPFLIPFSTTSHIPLQVFVSPKSLTIRSSPVVPPESVIVGSLGTQSKRLFSKSCFGQN